MGKVDQAFSKKARRGSWEFLNLKATDENRLERDKPAGFSWGYFNARKILVALTPITTTASTTAATAIVARGFWNNS